MKKTLLMALCLTVVAACGHRKRVDEFQGSSSAEAANIVTIRTGWIKDKKNNFDAELWFTNTNKKGIVLPVGRISCSRGGVGGSFQFLRFDSGMLELAPGEQRRIIARCDLGTKNQGEWQLNFKDISERAENGGAGKVISKELVLKLNRSAG